MNTNKILAYSVPTFVAALTATLVSALPVGMGWVMGVAIGILAGMTANLIARLVWHIVKHEMGQAFLASEVWYALLTGAFAWFVFNTSTAVQTSLVFVMLGCEVNALGFRWIYKDGADPMPEMEKAEKKAEAKEPSRKEKISALASSLRYKFMDDGVTPNLDAPLCVDEDGHHLTPAEADGKGLGAQYAEAIEYIKTIV